MTDRSSSVVVLSPHLDDAVFAVGAFIGSETAAGVPVVVQTIYSGDTAVRATTRRQRAFADYSVRCTEDDEALRILGASSRRIGLRERLFRPPPLRTPAQIFRTPRSAGELGDVDSIQATIHDTLANPGVVVMAPLGVGNHVDHVAVAVAALRCAVGNGGVGRIAFYEDFNALSECSRRRHPVARTAPFPWRDAPGWASPRSGLGMEAMSLLAAGPAATDYLRQESAGVGLDEWNWIPYTVPAAEYEQVKLDAVCEYRSQTKVLGGERQLCAMIHRSLARRGGEVVWRLLRRSAR
ncbi:PIG-L deacetylase family protein [Nocardia spumae]|uniref:PIG-L deacetylase family protein n=1 Tax=Nocardia spumae TaxID=2887190 RepID=UPI001D1572C6|nr:PIG-L family deacetylase [Nocardia spumae]